MISTLAIVLGALLTSVDGAAVAPTPVPPRHAERAVSPRVAAFLAAVADGREDAVRAFVRKNFSPTALKRFPVEQRVQRITKLASEIGPLELVRELPPRPDAVKFVARSPKTGKTITVSLGLEEDGGLEGVDVEDGEEAPEPVEKAKGSDAEVASAAAALFSGLAEKDEFSGAVIIARHGAPLFRHAYGMADRERSVPNSLDTKFNIASIGKVFTSAAIARLVRAGKLSMDDTIRKVLPDSKVPSADRITVRQLVEMRSGMGDIFGPDYDAMPKNRLRSLADFLPLFETKPLRFEPGKGREYSNAGYVVLGLMIEKASGRSYYDFVAENVLEPAGATSTGWWAQDEVIPNRAVGYTRLGETGPVPGGGRRSNAFTLPGRASSAGGGYSTAGDLLKIAMALENGTIETAERVSNPPGTKMTGGAGFAGGSPGVNGVVSIDFDRGIEIVVLTNDDPPSAEKIHRKLRQWMGGK